LNKWQLNNGRLYNTRSKDKSALRYERVDFARSDEDIFSLRDLLLVVQNRWLFIILVPFLLTGLVVGYSLLQTPMYEASAKILVSQKQGQDTTVDSLGSDIDGLQKVTQTMAELIKSRPIADAVIKQLDLPISSDDLLNNLSTGQINQTQLIRVDYRATSPEEAQRVVNAIGNIFSEQSSVVSPSANAAVSVTAEVWEPAQVPDGPVSPKFLLRGSLALVLGLVLGVVLALLLEYLEYTRIFPWAKAQGEESRQKLSPTRKIGAS
jgi:capsular polysaccharide biosynthesis protein